MFDLNSNEYQVLRSHFATLKGGRGQHRKWIKDHGRHKLPADFRKAIESNANAKSLLTSVVLTFIIITSLSRLKREIARAPKNYCAYYANIIRINL